PLPAKDAERTEGKRLFLCRSSGYAPAFSRAPPGHPLPLENTSNELMKPDRLFQSMAYKTRFGKWAAFAARSRPLPMHSLTRSPRKNEVHEVFKSALARAKIVFAVFFHFFFLRVKNFYCNDNYQDFFASSSATMSLRDNFPIMVLGSGCSRNSMC